LNKIYPILYLVLGQFISFCGNVGIVLLLAKELSSEELGHIAIINTVWVFTSQLIYGPSGNSFSRFYPEAEKKESLANYWAVLKRIILEDIVLIIQIFCVPLIGVLVYLDVFTWSFFIIIILYFILNGVYVSLLPVVNAFMKRGVYSIFQASMACFKLMILYAAFFMGKTQIFSVYSVYFLVCLIISAVLITYVKKFTLNSASSDVSEPLNKLQMNVKEFRRPFRQTAVFTWMQLSADKWVLLVFSNAKDVGGYSLLYQISYMPFVLISTVLNNLMAPRLNKFITAGGVISLWKKEDYFRKYIIAMAFFYGVISIFLYYFSEIVFKLYLPKEYLEFREYAILMIVGGGVYAFYQSLSLYFTAIKKNYLMTKSKIAIPIIAIIMYPISVFLGGFKGLVLSINITSLLYLSTVLFLIFLDQIRLHRKDSKC
jgi:O-antigen/teichoic acid export membrane protein